MTLTVDEETLARLTTNEKEQLDRILQAPDAVGFREFIDEVFEPSFDWYWYTKVIAARLEEVVEGRRDRLMVFLPRRHGKSELVSRLLPAYYLYRHPHRTVGLTSYSARKAVRDFSHNARRYYRRFGGDISEEASAKEQWENTRGGEVWASGAGGSITGSGFALGIVDDPIKNAEDARSEAERRKRRDWWKSTFYSSRDTDDASVVVVQTRWHEQDLSGWLLDRERSGDVEHGWHIVHFPGIAEDLPSYPDTCTVEPDPREQGEPLCPERRSLEDMEEQREASPYYFAAMTQGKPRPREGGMFQRSHFAYMDPSDVPNRGEVVRYWDRAATSGGGDYTVGVKARWYEHSVGSGEHRFVIEDVARGQWGTEEREDRFSEVIERDGPDVKQWIEQEGGSSGQDAVRATAQRNPGYRIEGDKVTGSKEDRADPLASWGATSNIYLARAPWNDAFVRELTGFPNARHDDQVDAASGAFNAVSTEDSFFFVGRA